MRFHDVSRISRADAEKAFDSGDAGEITSAMVSVAYHDPDWRWVQDVCLGFLTDENAEIRGLAATCLGHLARIHRQLDRGRVVPALLALASDPKVGGHAEDALDDIDQYLR